MSERDFPRRPPRATCEDYDDDDDNGDDSEDDAIDTRISANFAAKRSKPELQPKASYERHRNNGTDSGYASRAGTVGSGSPNRRDKKVTELKVDTSFQERESRPYHYTTPNKTETRQPSGRPATDLNLPRPLETKKYYKHKEGECWVCDKYGKHIEPPKGTPVPISPTMARRPQVAEDYVSTQPSQVQPQVRRTSSNRGPRPASMYAATAPGLLYETKTLPSPFPQESPSYATASWHPPTTPLTVQYTPLTPVAYAQYPVVTTTSQPMTPVESQGSYFHNLPPARTRPVEPSRRASMYDQSDRPVVQQAKPTSTRPRDEVERTYERRPPLQTQRSSQDRDRDRRAMPPPPVPQPEQVLLARRPSIKKAATSISSPASYRHSQSYDTGRDEFPRLEVIRERRAEASVPPTSYRGPPAAIPDRPPNRKSVSYDQSKHSVEVGTARGSTTSEPQSRRMTEPSPVERYEAEAEAYQRTRGSSEPHNLQSHSLTAEALRKVPKLRPLDARSETNSSQKSRNSSSKGSSGAKTGRSNSDIKMRINGIAVGIPADSGQRITIQSKGVNISVSGKGRNGDKEYGGGSRADGRAPSVASRTSKTSSSREKERRGDRRDDDSGSGSRRVLREGDKLLRSTTLSDDRAGRRRSQSISRYLVSRDRETEELVGFGA